jgi:hypothetical protein
MIIYVCLRWVSAKDSDANINKIATELFNAYPNMKVWPCRVEVIIDISLVLGIL